MTMESKIRNERWMYHRAVQSVGSKESLLQTQQDGVAKRYPILVTVEIRSIYLLAPSSE